MLPLYRKAAANSVARGGVIAYPTEAVWGIGCDPFNERAIADLLAIKKRSASKGVIILLSKQAAQQVLEKQDQAARQIICQQWPAYLTWVIPNKGMFAQTITGNRDKVAVRYSAFGPLQDLLNACGGFLVSTSANISGAKAARHAWQMPQRLRSELDFIVPGHCQGLARPSTIKDALTGDILRS